MGRQLLQKFTLLILALGFAVSMHAQVTTSGISGTVTDKLTKETLIGATVVAKHLPTGTTYGAVTNEKGNYTLNGLRPGGPYTVEVSYIGYNKKVFKGINLSLGNTEYLNVWLGENAQELEQVFIIGSKDAGFNARRTGASSNFNRKAIENAPNVNRSLFDVAKLTPQANVTKGGISFAGSNNRYNSFQIDGAVSNDTFGLSGTGTNGGQAGTNPISLEAIDALQIVIAPFDVRQGGFTGGGINAVTKSGTNTFKGSVYDYFHNQDFYGKTAGEDLKEDDRKKLEKQMQNTTGVTLGGPIIKDKLFFFFNGEYEKNVRPATFTLGNGSDITQAEADAFMKKYKKLTGGYDGGGFGKRDVNSHNYKALLRFDWNISQAHKLSLRYSYLNAMREDYRNTPKKLILLNSGHTFYNETHSVVAELNSRFSNKVSNELRFGYNRVRDHRETDGPITPQISAGYHGNTIVAGTDRHSIGNRLNQDIFTLSDNLTFNLGDHKLVLGTHNELYNFYNVYLPNINGFYSYNSIDDFVNGKKFYRFERTKVNKNVVDDAHWGPRFKAMQLGFYIQDEWKATDRLRLTYGLRMDLPLFLDSPQENPAFNKTELAKEWDVNNSKLPKATPLWSPRIGFRYDLDETHNFLIRGGAGIFTGRVPFVWISNNFVNTGIQLEMTNISGKEVKPDVLANIPMKENELLSNPGRSSVDFVHRDFKFPQVARFNLAFDAKLPWGIKATLEGMFTKNLNNALYRNINVKETGKMIPFQKTSAETVAWETDVNKDYTYLIMLDNTSRGYSYNLTATLSKSFDFGLSASVAYTYGKAMSQMDNGSSVASSNWKYAPIHTSTAADPIAISNFDVRHRIVANLTYSRDYAKHFGTTISLLYNGQSGDVFSAMYASDVNGDGEKNDLMYIPTNEEIKKMKFYGKSYEPTPEEQRKAFQELIDGNEELQKYQGQFAPRNGFNAPFLNQFDLHFAQNFYFNVGKRRQTIQLNADVVNIGNFFNHAWGLHKNVSHNNVTLLSYNPQYGSYTYKPKPLWYVSDISSRWHAQVGIKYIF